MKQKFRHTRSYAGLILRKERLPLLLMILGLASFLVGLVPVLDELLKSSSNQAFLLETMKNPAMISLVGPVFVDSTYTTGSLYANYMTVFTGIMLAIANILFVNRHTRVEEEEGRLELMRSLAVGELANISAVILVSLILNLALGVLLIVGFSLISSLFSTGMDLIAILCFSLTCSVFGFLMAVITAFFAQLSSSARISSTLSFLSLLTFYLLRAIGDLSLDFFSLLSPLGMITKTESFVNNYFWPPVILLVEAALLILFTYRLAESRDLNDGLIRERAGRDHLSPWIQNVFGFTFQLHRSMILIWALVIFLFSAMYGAVLGDLEGYVQSSEMIQMMVNMDSDISLTNQFISLLIVIISIITTIPVISFAKRILSEEKKAYSDHLLAGPVSRSNYLASFFLVSLVGLALFQALIALGFWSVGKNYLQDIPDLSTFLFSTFNYLPAILVFLSMTLLVIGLCPKYHWLPYLYLAYSFVIIYLGKLLDLPKIMSKLTPFGLTPQYPGEKPDLLISLALVTISLIMAYLGFSGYKRREIGS